MTYLQKEQDYRGLVAGKGWAHAPAHGGDLLDQAAKHPQFGKERVADALVSVQTILLNNKEVFIANEESRFDTCLVTKLENHWLSSQELVAWAQAIEAQNAQLTYADVLFLPRMHTWHAFLESVYFKMKAKKLTDLTFAAYIEKLLTQYFFKNGFI